MKSYKTLVLNLVSLVLGCFVVVLSVQAEPYQPLCVSYFSPLLQKTVPYCIDRTHPEMPITSGERVAYFFHGTNGSAQSWFKNNYANSLNQMREDGEEMPPMTFVSFNTSRYSFFTDHPGKPSEAYETWFITEFVPYIEKTYGVCNQKQCRAVIGESMGGFGALKTAFRHTDMFASVAVNSPALPPFSVRAPLREWVWFFAHHAIGPVVGFFLIELVRHIYLDEESWDAHDPISLSETLPLEQFPPTYFDMGGKDRYGFAVGYGILRQVLDTRGVDYTTIFEPSANHDMWKRHASDSIRFLCNHTVDAHLNLIPPPNSPPSPGGEDMNSPLPPVVDTDPISPSTPAGSLSDDSDTTT